MKRVLLTSEKTVKELACINDNVASAYILSAITEAQETKLKSILGPALLASLKAKVEDGTLDVPGNEYYKELVDQCQYFLAYTAVTELTYKTTFKITNFGVVRSSDENLSVPDFEDVAKVREYYQAKADYYCIELQTYAFKHWREFPELTANCRERIKSNLYSAASCGIFLGGARGKR